MGAISPARQAAFRILLAVERGPSHSDVLLRGSAIDSLGSADRNLATALVLGVLRWQIWLDGQIRPLLKHPQARLDEEIRIALRLGAYQLLFLDRIPPHAAIDESVELAKRAGHRFAAGMVNAVLRKMAARRETAAGAADSDAALLESHPEWMVERWTNRYGADAACAICRHGQGQPKLALRIEDPGAEAEMLAAGIQLAPGELLAAARVVTAGDVTATAAFREGRVRIQDEGSQLIAEIAAWSGKESGRDVKTILDACAAPGGKTLILAERFPQAQIVACDASPQRLAGLRNRLAGQGKRVECRLADAAALSEGSVFDVALADVPCSGTGTLGRNPEIRHRLQMENLVRQSERQQAILRSVFRAVRTGGRVVYSTCSLEPEENEEIVAAQLAENASARPVSLRGQIESLLEHGILTREGAERLRDSITPEGALRLLPDASAADGFFIALIERAE